MNLSAYAHARDDAVDSGRSGGRARAQGIRSALANCGAAVDVRRLPVGRLRSRRTGPRRAQDRSRSSPDADSRAVSGGSSDGLRRIATRSPCCSSRGRPSMLGPCRPARFAAPACASAELGIILLRSSDPADSAAWLFRLAVRARSSAEVASGPPMRNVPQPRADPAGRGHAVRRSRDLGRHRAGRFSLLRNASPLSSLPAPQEWTRGRTASGPSAMPLPRARSTARALALALRAEREGPDPST